MSKWYKCEVSWEAYATARVQANSLEEAKEKFAARNYYNLYNEMRDRYEFDIESTKLVKE